MIYMELQSIAHRLSRKRRIWLLGIAALAGTGYGFYRLYKSPSIDIKKYRLLAFFSSIIKISEAASVSAETVSLLSNDVKNFVALDSYELPPSLKQLHKIYRCREFNEALTEVSGAVAAGICEGFNAAEGEGLLGGVMDKIFTAAGTGFASVVVGSFARNLVMSVFENMETLDSNSRPPGGLEFVDLMLCNNKFRALVAEFVQSFVGAAVTIYLDKTVDINVYDRVFSALTNPQHEAQTKGIMMGIFSGAVETFIRVSHDVLRNGSSGSKQNICSGDGESETIMTQEEEEEEEEEVGLSSNSLGNNIEETVRDNSDLGFGHLNPDHQLSWIDKVSHTFSIPSNRRLLVDIGGRMTFEALRSFFEFLLCKFSDFFSKILPVALHDALNRLLETLRYVGDKSTVAATVCLAIFWHSLTGTRLLDVV